uniref:Replication factor C subunit 5 n=1 Tax=Timema tahoe TaxID=61484 RepID=A0A7R9FH88_9NEOP|nr:unnamed protein product [Timema tahoe]
MLLGETSKVLELNASDDRGIGIVRGQILSFASTRTIFKSGFKLIILDEADAMTNDAQNALRRIIEKFTENVRFCIICNYLSKIIPAVQSRCTRFRFGPLNPDQILPRLEYVIEQENVSATEDGKKALLTLAQGDMRKVLNVLQSTSMAYKEVTEDNVYTCVGHPLKNDIANIVKWLLKILDLKTAKGLALQDILTEVHLYVHRLVATMLSVFIENEREEFLTKPKCIRTMTSIEVSSISGVFSASVTLVLVWLTDDGDIGVQIPCERKTSFREIGAQRRSELTCKPLTCSTSDTTRVAVARELSSLLRVSEVSS